MCLEPAFFYYYGPKETIHNLTPYRRNYVLFNHPEDLPLLPILHFRELPIRITTGEDLPLPTNVYYQNQAVLSYYESCNLNY